MAAYLLAWNPKRWGWPGYEELRRQVAAGQPQPYSWGCGHSRRPQPGDRVFLIRLGVPPRGIVAAGRVVGEPYATAPFDAEKAAAGQHMMALDFELDAMARLDAAELLPLGLLKSHATLGAMHWETRLSGVRIPDAVAEALEEVWAERVGK